MALFREDYKLSGKLVTLRNAEPDDAPALLALLRRYDEETTFLTREPGELTMTEDEERAYIQAQRDADNRLLLLAEVAGRPVGSSGAFFDTRLRTRHIGQLGIAIEEAHWGMGIGRALMEAALSWLRQSGVERATLTVDTANTRAIALYMRVGFTVDGMMKHERKLADGTYRDGYWMSMTL